MPDEKKLVKQFNRGSKDALCQIYKRYKKDLYGFAISLLNDTHAAEDAVHDVFLLNRGPMMGFREVRSPPVADKATSSRLDLVAQRSYRFGFGR